jgi:hypothetical protein
MAGSGVGPISFAKGGFGEQWRQESDGINPEIGMNG